VSKKLAEAIAATPRVRKSRAAADEQNIALELEAAGLKRRVKIRTKQGVRELTHAELLLLLRRRALVESDVQADRKPRYKTCAAAGCVLLIPIRMGGNRKRCPTHRKEIQKEWTLRFTRKERATNPEKVRERKRKWYAANPEKVREMKQKWKRANREEINARERIRRAANRKEINARERIRRAASPEKTRASYEKYNAKRRAERAAKKAKAEK
jgi:hypothetical protein